eukprot:Skav203015  [mRNA]  locus=scaffold583:79179:80293:+ [translate_table: standard]
MTEPAVLKRFAGDWRGLFSACEKFPNSPNVGEFTADNLALTDPAFAKASTTPLSVKKEDLFTSVTPLLGFDLPPALRYSYGDSFAQVRFLVLLREPIARAHSLLHHFMFYHAEEARAKSFVPGDHLTQELRAFVDDHVMSYNIWHGLYGRHLLEWFSHWPASQFLVVPYKYLISKTETVCASVMQHLNIKMQCFHLQERLNHRVTHPAVEQQALKGEFTLLVDVLVSNSKDVIMPALEPKGGATHADVRLWLENGW